MSVFNRQPQMIVLAVMVLVASGCNGGRKAGLRGAESREGPTPVVGRMVERGPNCGSCSITVAEAGVLGAMEDELPIGDGSFLVETSSGRCIVGPTDRDGELLAFDDCRGAPVSLGVAGEGPGELGVVRTIARWRGDSLLSFGYGRLAILSGESGQGRTLRFDPGTESFTITTVPGDSSVVVNNNHPTKPQFSVIRADGTIGSSFGLPAPLLGGTDGTRNRVALGRSIQPSSFWAGQSFYGLALVRWSLTGEALATITPNVKWFTPYDSTDLAKAWAGGAGVARPLPYLGAIHETDDGFIWVAHAVAASEWRPDSAQVAEGRARSGEARRRSSSRPEHYDGMLSAIDPATGQHLVTVQVADVIVGFANDTLAYVRRLGGDGTQQLVLLRIGLLR